MYKAVIFDLDGTLLDTIEDIAISCNFVLKQFGKPPFSLEEYKLFVGQGANQLFKDILPELNEEEQKKAKDIFEEHYAKQYSINTKLYPDINKLLTFLKTRGFKLAILSNKPNVFTKKCAIKYLKDWEFDVVYGIREGIERKPNPQGVFDILDELKVEAGETLFIGDTKVDMQTAKNASMDSVGVLWGFRGEKELREHGAKYIVKTPKELIKLIGEM